MNFWTRIKIVSLHAAGAPPQIVRHASPADQLRLHLIGVSAIIPAIMAFGTGGVTFLMFAPGKYMWAWLVVAPLTFSFMLLLEIVLNASLSPALPVNEKIKLGLVRIAFSIVLALTISMPLKLALFEGPILLELKMMQAEKEDEIRRMLYGQLAELEVDADAARRRLDDHADKCDSRHAELIAEIDGKAGAGKAGFGKLAAIKAREYATCNTEKAVLQKKLETLESRLALQKDRVDEKAEARIAAARAVGNADLMSRLGAFSRLVQKDGLLGLAGLLIVLLLTFIDIIPTMVKVFARLDSYREAERHAGLEAGARMRARKMANPRILRARADEIVAHERDKRLLRSRSLRTWVRLRLMRLEYDERLAVETQQVTNGVYEDADFDRVLAKYDQQLIDLDNARRKSDAELKKVKNNESGDSNTASSAMPDISINRKHTQEHGFARDRGSQPSSRRYRKDELF